MVMSEYEVIFWGDVINCVRDDDGKEYNLQEIISILQEQQKEISRLRKIIDLTQYQLNVQDRIINEYENQEISKSKNFKVKNQEISKSKNFKVKNQEISKSKNFKSRIFKLKNGEISKSKNFKRKFQNSKISKPKIKKFQNSFGHYKIMKFQKKK
jgi:hypothetical protein